MPTSTTSRFPSVSRRLRIPSRAAWLGARAANVRRRPFQIAAVWLGIGALLAFVILLRPVWDLVPQDSRPTLGAFVIGIAVISLFASVTIVLAEEMRRPRVANVMDAERLSGLRVLTVARWRPVPAQRARRDADRSLPKWLDPSSDDYRILAWHLTSAWPRDGLVTVACEDPMVAALVGTNLAATFAVDARATLLVDADFVHEPVRTLLDLPAAPGLVAVMENRRRWSESLVPFTVGRSRTMHVLPSGHRSRTPGPTEAQATVGELVRAAKRHDATVVVSTPRMLRSLRAGDDVVLCVVEGESRIDRFERDVAALIDGGCRVRGIVLWQGPRPKGNRVTAAAVES